MRSASLTLAPAVELERGMRVASFVLLSLVAAASVGCLSNVSVPEGALIDCGSIDDCPSTHVCSAALGRCVLAGADDQPPSLDTESLQVSPALASAGALYAQLEGGDRGVPPVDSASTLEVTGIEVDVTAKNADEARLEGPDGAVLGGDSASSPSAGSSSPSHPAAASSSASSSASAASFWIASSFDGVSRIARSIRSPIAPAA